MNSKSLINTASMFLLSTVLIPQAIRMVIDTYFVVSYLKIPDQDIYQEQLFCMKCRLHLYWLYPCSNPLENAFVLSGTTRCSRTINSSLTYQLYFSILKLLKFVTFCNDSSIKDVVLYTFKLRHNWSPEKIRDDFLIIFLFMGL